MPTLIYECGTHHRFLIRWGLKETYYTYFTVFFSSHCVGAEHLQSSSKNSDGEKNPDFNRCAATSWNALHKFHYWAIRETENHVKAGWWITAGRLQLLLTRDVLTLSGCSGLMWPTVALKALLDGNDWNICLFVNESVTLSNQTSPHLTENIVSLSHHQLDRFLKTTVDNFQSLHILFTAQNNFIRCKLNELFIIKEE